MLREFMVTLLTSREEYTVSAPNIDAAEPLAFARTTEKIASIVEMNNMENPSFIFYDVNEPTNVSRDEYARRASLDRQADPETARLALAFIAEAAVMTMIDGHNDPFIMSAEKAERLHAEYLAREEDRRGMMTADERDNEDHFNAAFDAWAEGRHN